MAETTQIGWTNRFCPHTRLWVPGKTFNPWIGCTKVPGSPACVFCYAAGLDDKRFSKTLGGATPEAPISHWGEGAPRHTTKTWGDPHKWNRQAANLRTPPAVFCASLSDWADEEVGDAQRWRLFDEVIALCPNLDFLLLTKRTANARRFMGEYYKRRGIDYLPNVWMGATMENQEWFDARIDDLLAIPAVRHFASCEPLFGTIDLFTTMHGARQPRHKLDWVIAGGESCDNDPRQARPTHPDDATDLQAQCWSAGTPFYWKQWGELAPAYELDHNAQAQAMCAMNKVEMIDTGRGEAGRRYLFRVGKHVAGNTLNGRQSLDMPTFRDLGVAA